MWVSVFVDSPWCVIFALYMIAPAPRSTRFVHINRQTERKMIWWFKFWAPKLHSIIFTTYTPMPLLRFRFSFRCLCLFSWNLAFGAFFFLLKWSFAYILLVVCYFLYIFLYFYLPLPQLLCIVLKPHQKPLRLMLLDWDGTSSRIVNARHTDWKTLLLYYFTLIWLIFFFRFIFFVVVLFCGCSSTATKTIWKICFCSMCRRTHCICVYTVYVSFSYTVTAQNRSLRHEQHSKIQNNQSVQTEIHHSRFSPCAICVMWVCMFCAPPRINVPAVVIVDDFCLWSRTRAHLIPFDHYNV